MHICNMVVPYIFGLLIFLAVGGLFVNKYFYKQLKSNFPETYKELGEPTNFFNHSIKNSFLVNKFIFKRQYLKLNNPGFTNYCNFMLAYGIAIWIIFITFAVMSIICSL